MLRARRWRLATVLAAALGLSLCASTAAAEGGTVTGQVRADVPGVALANLHPIVVYLAPADDSSAGGARLPAARVRQKDARFVPGFLVVAAGQTVEMPNDDVIFHNVFSFSRPNDFDLGLYASGNSKSVAFEHPGVVRIYCSIHENMNGTILVAPTPYFATADASGRFRVRDVPAGRYRLETWSEKLPLTSRPITVAPGVNAVGVVPLIETPS